MGEAAILQQVGGPAITYDQLGHIVRAIREYDVTVQSSPFSADADAAHPEAGTIAFSAPAWATFLSDARDGLTAA